LNLIDIFFAFLLIYFSYKGYKKGFMTSLVSFISFFISILIALNYSTIASNFLLILFPESEKLVVGFISIIITFFISIILINKLTSTLKYIIDLTLVGIIDDISGALFGFTTTAFLISFSINIFQYFDITVFEEEIRKSIISFYLFDFAPNIISYFVDFFPSLEIIVDNGESKKLTV